MTTNYRRIALLTGASITALGLATPALAAPHYPAAAPHDDAADGLYPGTNVVVNPSNPIDEIVICEIGAPDPDPCFFGEVQTGSGDQFASTGNVISQTVTAATDEVNLDIVNATGDSAEIGAVAISTKSGDAFAYLSNAIAQSVNGADDDVSATVTNNGSLLIDALAVAAYDTAAHAYATLARGIDQYANSTGGNVELSVVNDGYMTIAATAVANGQTNALAIANNGAQIQTKSGYITDVDGGPAILQDANSTGGNASNNVTNDGELNIGAYAAAYATSGNATAEAQQKSGIIQDAFASGDNFDASNSIDNNGLLTIAASAVATGTTDAFASAVNKSAIFQGAEAHGAGDASNTITNSATGTIDIHAVASVDGQVTATLAYASAYASVINGISQRADAFDGGNASNLITNSGGLNISATANAQAGYGSANASAVVGGTTMFIGYQSGVAIHQHARASDEGNAINGIVNDATGSISIEAVANAFSTGAEANAAAYVTNGIVQEALAFGTGYASNTITNGGSISIGANGYASGGANTTASNDAQAYVSGAIFQGAVAFDGGNASNTISNADAGVIDITAYATALGAGADNSATAYISSAVVQYATAFGGGDAVNTFANDGALNIVAHAVAASGASASANAYINGGVFQEAYASDGGYATNVITNGSPINISAFASATGTDADADAHITSAITQVAIAIGGGNATNTITNEGELSITAVANGYGTSADADADASVGGIYQYAYASGGSGDAVSSITNSGPVTISASANATGYTSADANATINYGIDQSAYAYGSGNAFASLTNAAAAGTAAAGSIDITAVANAVSTFGYASAEAHLGTAAIYQFASATGGGYATANIVNGGTINLAASAYASGIQAAYATANGTAPVRQYAIAGTEGDARVNLFNSGELTVGVNAVATATGHAYASAMLDGGILQQATATESGNALAYLSNAAYLTVAAHAAANGGTAATANAIVKSGVAQNASAGSGYATASLVNVGSLNILAGANASATSGSASALAVAGKSAAGIEQFANGGLGSLASIDNDGSINVAAVAYASGTAGAVANAYAFGAAQSVQGTGYLTASFVNGSNGSFAVTASANASATDGYATAHANAAGLSQHPNGGLALFDNAGSFDVNAHAFATGVHSYASANAVGHNLAAGPAGIKSGTGPSFEIDWTNQTDATFNVSASATAQSAYASAVGINASVLNDYTTAYATAEAALEGSIVNNGTFSVLAHASGSGTSGANATGINLNSGINRMEVTNTGTLNVEAMTANGGPATATGIRVTGNGTGLAPAVDDVFTFTNDGGDITVRQSTDGGTSWQRGMAIDVDEAPNPSVINLLGDGSIYGNVEIAGTDLILVADGETSFDGIVNPACMPAGGPGDLVLDSAVPGEGANCGVGTLTIADGGTLFLRDRRNDASFADMYDGPSYVFVEEFNVDAGGTIAFGGIL